MTFNNEVFHKTSAEVNTQVASYFDVVDNAMAMSDTNHKYYIDAQASYSPSALILAGSFTTFIISPTCDNTADIYNGFIKDIFRINVRLDKKLNISKVNGYNFDSLWVGFKDAMDAVEKYEILSNGISIYTQNLAPEESFITACGANEASKRADIFSKVRHKDIFHRRYELAHCGNYVEFTDADGNKLDAVDEVEIPLKIDLCRFLPLSNIKYLPAFAGKLELKIMFGTQALVYCPCGPSKELMSTIQDYINMSFEDITNEFTPIGEPVKMWTDSNCSDPYNLTTDDRTLTVTRVYEVYDCHSIIPNFSIDADIYNALIQRYTRQKLIFPTQILIFTTMSKKLSDGHSSSTQTITPRFIDSIFFLFPLKAHIILYLRIHCLTTSNYDVVGMELYLQYRSIQLVVKIQC